MKKLTSLLLALCLATGLLAGCGGAPSASAPASAPAAPPSQGGSAPAGELPTLRVAVMPLVTSLPVKYVMENKLDEERGFKIEPLTFSTGAPMNEALGADLWDVSTIGVAAVTSVGPHRPREVAGKQRAPPPQPPK